MKKITILCLFLTFVTLFIVSCIDSNDISESVTEVIFPEDIPIYPGAVQTMGYQIGFLTIANYNIDADIRWYIPTLWMPNTTVAGSDYDRTIKYCLLVEFEPYFYSDKIVY